MPDFLLELGLEEIPARMIAAAQAELLKRTLALLQREHLIDSAEAATATSYSTPRRLAVLIQGVEAQQPDITEETTGPAVKIAYKDGIPTPAAEAFARKSGVAITELRTIATPKGDYLAATSVKKGRSAATVIAEELPKEIAGIYWAKNMRWMPENKQTFVRPVEWIACLLGDEVVPINFGGKTAGRASYGHRVLSTGETFEIVTPESYLAQLEGEYVLADVEARRHKIRKALDRITREAATRTVPGLRWREDHDLVDAVTHLTEWPDVLLGSFEPAYLALPEEVLVTVMRDHQKYFAVETADGKLAPYFLTVTNIALDATNAPTIRQGNERVLRARFNDARFFWEFDQRTPLAERVKLLENVTFQKDLGSYAKKSERVTKTISFVAEAIQAYLPAVRVDIALRASALAKADLTTELVKEFTELQGVIGGLYARAQGEEDAVVLAIYDQYKPNGAKDSIPTSIEGAILGMIDRLDTITGMFGLGLVPTGSKDPFGLRRAANAVIRIIAETDIGVWPSILQGAALASRARHGVDQPGVSVGTVDDVMAFFRERIEFYLRESRGQTHDVVKAVMAAGSDDIRDLVARAEAVTAVRSSADFLAVSAAFKRMKNILAQANFVMPDTTGIAYSEGTPEAVLVHRALELRAAVDSLRERHAYREALEAIATIRPQVDAFFDGVMVMDPDPEVRRQRLTVLAMVLQGFSTIADFSEIVTAG